MRVSTTEQGTSGLGLDAQRAAIEAEVARRGWSPVCIAQDVASGRSLDRRINLTAALDALDRGEAEVLIVVKLDRLSRSLVDFAALMQRARRKGWAIIALDLGVDMTTPAGELVANVVAATAQYERSLISERTRVALAAKKAQGYRLGRPVRLPVEVRQRVARERAEGRTLAAIAADLTTEGVPTSHGGARWHPSTVHAVLRSISLDTVVA